MKDTLVFLVHGTWGGQSTNKILNLLPSIKRRKKLWFDNTSEFVENITLFERCDCEPFYWNGSNCFNERDNAARQLAKEIERKFLEKNYRKLIIIGHSHGGNIALKSFDYIKRSIFNPSSSNSSIITMATPFFFYKNNKLNKNHIYTWYSLVFSIFILDFFDSRKGKRKGIFNNFCGINGIIFFTIPILYRVLNYVFYRGKQTYDPKKVEFDVVKREKIPVYVIRTSHDEAALFVNMNSYILLIFNSIFNLIFNRNNKNTNNIIPFVIATSTISKVITQKFFEDTYVVSFFKLNNKYTISTILYLWVLYILSYALMGMPLNGLKETDISIESTPDADFNVSIDTITDENVMFSYEMRHAVYKNKKCTNIMMKIFRENFI